MSKTPIASTLPLIEPAESLRVPEHCDRTSYLDKSDSSQPTASYYLGHDFEHKCMHLLQRMHFDIRHCGRTGDAGVDLEGRWLLPEPSVAILAQCKFTRRLQRLSVVVVREWEGVLSRFDVVDRPLGLLISSTTLSDAALARFKSSSLPMMFMSLGEDAKLQALCLNDAAQARVPDITIAADPSVDRHRIVNKCKQEVTGKRMSLWPIRKT